MDADHLLMLLCGLAVTLAYVWAEWIEPAERRQRDRQRGFDVIRKE